MYTYTGTAALFYLQTSAIIRIQWQVSMKSAASLAIMQSPIISSLNFLTQLTPEFKDKIPTHTPFPDGRFQ